MVETDLIAELKKRIIAQAPKWYPRAMTWLKEHQVNINDIASFEGSVELHEDYWIVLSSFQFKPETVSEDATIIAEKKYINKGDVTIDDQFSYSKTVEDSFTFKFSKGLKTGTKVTVDAKIPLIKVGGSVEVSGEYSFDSEQSWTTRKTETFSDTITIHVPAKTTVEATATLSTEKGRLAFTGTATVTNTRAWVTVWFKLKGPGYTDCAIPLGILLPTDADREVPVDGTLDDSLAIIVTVTTNPMQALPAVGR